MVAVFCFSCRQIQTSEPEEPCWLAYSPPQFFNSIKVKIPCEPSCWPDVTTYYKEGIFHIDFDIESEQEGEAFILLALRQAGYWFDEWGNVANYHVSNGFGNVVKVDGYEICSYHQLTDFRTDILPHIVPNNKIKSFDTPTFEFPVYVKKITVPKNGTIHEIIKVHLPEPFTSCWGEIFLFRNSKAIEESMKTKIDPKLYKGNYAFDTYCKLFPDSTLFSYLITCGLNNLVIDYCENIGTKNISFCWEKYEVRRLDFISMGVNIGWLQNEKYHLGEPQYPMPLFFLADRPRNLINEFKINP